MVSLRATPFQVRRHSCGGVRSHTAGQVQGTNFARGITGFCLTGATRFHFWSSNLTRFSVVCPSQKGYTINVWWIWISIHVFHIWNYYVLEVMLDKGFARMIGKHGYSEKFTTIFFRLCFRPELLARQWNTLWKINYRFPSIIFIRFNQAFILLQA